MSEQDPEPGPVADEHDGDLEQEVADAERVVDEEDDAALLHGSGPQPPDETA